MVPYLDDISKNVIILTKMDQSGENRQNPALRYILTKDHGITFLDKRQLNIPYVDSYKFLNTISVNDRLKVGERFESIRRFLQMEPVGDNKFGSKHNPRRVWREELIRAYGPKVQAILIDNNQIRQNALAKVVENMELVGEFVQMSGGDETASLFSKSARLLFCKIHGLDPKTGQKVFKAYYELGKLDDKLQVVHFVEDAIVSLLKELSIRFGNS